MDKTKSKSANEILRKLNELENTFKKQTDKPLTFQQATEYLGISKSYLYKLTARKQIPHYKPKGKLIYFDKRELNEWVYNKQCTINK